MSFAITQDQAELKNALELQRQAELSALSLVSVEAKKSSVESVDVTELEVAFRVAGCSVEEGVLSTDVDFILGSPAQDSEEPALFVSFSYNARYQLNEDYEPLPAHVGAFCAGNAIMNCWPYARENVQSTLARMGVAAPPLPFLKLVARTGDLLMPPRGKKGKKKKAARPDKQRTAKKLGSGGKVSKKKASGRSRSTEA